MNKINRVAVSSSPFTSVLNNYEGMPTHLYVRGKLPKESLPAVAIVGSRRPTAYGIDVTYKFAYSLAKQGVVIISGLASGVDAIAHTACLEAGGTTIAVLANGLNNIYPKSNEQLAKRILESGGAIISEYENGTEARPYFFLARNRLVSGLANALLVTEATAQSGTFSTVNHAITQNKDVFAIPGPITSLLSAGANQILQTGAHIALRPSDIIDMLPMPNMPKITSSKGKGKNHRLPLGDTPLEMAIINNIHKGMHSGDEILARLNCSSAEFATALTFLELGGKIKALGGNTWGLHIDF